MAFVHGKKTWLVIDGTDVSQYVNQSSLNRVIDLFETSTFGDDDKTQIAGLRGFELSGGGPWDPTLDGVLDAADDGATVAWQLAPGGSATMGYNGNAFLNSYNIDDPVGGGATWSMGFTISGAVTRGTQS